MASSNARSAWRTFRPNSWTQVLGRLAEGMRLEVPIGDRVLEDVLDVTLQPYLEAAGDLLE
eukprot:7788384-Alexandrium_andersonii.AAC.1